MTEQWSGGFALAQQEAAFTPEEENALKARLWTLLERQARLQTQGDHSSLREEAAAELLRSLVFTLQFQRQRQSLPMHALLAADLPGMLKAGQRALCLETNTAQTLYAMAQRSVRSFGSRALQDTLHGIGLFFKQYDVQLHAHAIPASIDYPLCHPVPEALEGVLYIRAYLERLLMENRLVTRFSPERVTALLQRSSPDYRELLQNLYEPVAATAIGFALLQQDAASLAIIRAQAVEIHTRLAGLSQEAVQLLLARAAETACEQLTVTGEKERAYLANAAQTLIPRIALPPQSACGVFYAV